MGGLAFSRKDLALALDNIGVGEGDLVFFQICADAAPGEDLDQACANIYGALRDAVGPEGTIVVPTYTFSFCRRQIFDPATTPTEGGPYNSFAAFPEFVRGLPNARRSEDPIFSVAAVGPGADALLKDLPHECLGRDSIFDRVRQADGKLVLLGIGLYEAVFRHYVESVLRVPWRYDKQFSGDIRERGGGTRRETWLYNVRIFAANGDPAGEALEAMALAEGVGSARRVGDTFVQMARAREFHQFCVREIEHDPWCCAVGPPGDVIEIERRRVNAVRERAALRPDSPMADVAEALRRLPRAAVSAGYDVALSALAERAPLKIERWRTGTHCGDWIIPEEWNCRTAHVETIDGRRVLSPRDGAFARPYSHAFDGVVERDELTTRLLVDGEPAGASNWIDRDWGFLCTPAQRAGLSMAHYRVVIESSFSYGAMGIGALDMAGASSDTIVLAAHLTRSRPDTEMIDGAVVAVEVARALMARPKRRFSYLLLLSPEQIGSMPYLERYPDIAGVIRGGLLIGAVGNAGAPTLTLSGVDRKFDQNLTRALTNEDPQAVIQAGPPAGPEAPSYHTRGVPLLTLSRGGSAAPASALVDQLEVTRRLVLKLIDAIEADA
ncbi:DUF4910 domain-containing protein [Terricaulis sp.]|uniref:DUF4910 domain-containing protein n=1 Tax=Terricaulis sp. TaxID=2768686 RepID=UPI003784DB05